jgi:hypothetical protein
MLHWQYPTHLSGGTWWARRSKVMPRLVQWASVAQTERTVASVAHWSKNFMDVQDINSLVTAKRQRTVKSGFIPQLTLGSQPQGLGSVVAPVTPTGDTVFSNAVPYVSGGYRHPLAPSINPGTQNQQYQNTSATVPPWVSVPACRIGARPPKAPPIGIQGGTTMAAFNFPAPKSVLTLTTF